MSRLRLGVWLVAFLFTPSVGTAGFAQDLVAEPCSSSFARLAPMLTTGERLLVVGPGGAEFVGTLQTVSAAALSVAIDGRRRDFRPEDVKGLFRLARNTGRGAAIGLGIGAAVGLALGGVVGASETGYLVGSLFFGGIGSAAGAGIGAGSSRRIDVYGLSCAAAPRGTLAARQPPDVPPQVPASRPSPAQASLSRPRPDRRWEASFVMGTTSSGPARDLEAAMKAERFDEFRGSCFIGFCLPGVTHPFSTTGFGQEGFPWVVSGRRWLSSWYGVGLSGGVSDIGSTHGQRRDSGEYLTLRYRAATVAPLFVVRPGRGVSTGLGPSFVSTSFRSGLPGAGEPVVTETHRRVGLVWELEASVPPRSRVFAELLLQYRYVGRVDAGPFRAMTSFTGVPVTLSRTSLGMNHWFAGVGAGVRF